MKFSDAALIGMERFPEQAIGFFQKGDKAACIGGCINWALTGDAFDAVCWRRPEWMKFTKFYGESPAGVNNSGVLREDIVGMMQAIGL